MNEKHLCAHCGEFFELSDMTETADGILVCEECLMEHYEQCTHCGDWFPQGELSGVNNGSEWFCDSCLAEYASVCDDCGEYFTDRWLWLDDYRGTICDGCSDHWHICEDCGRLIHDDDTYYVGDNWDYPYCENCIGDHTRSEYIHDYGYKPHPVIRRRKGESELVLTFGAELEIDGAGECGEAAKEVTEGADDRVYCKHDGSLDDGFEIVTHPGSLAHHMYEMRWSNICRIAKNLGYKSHDAGTCGLHVHVGRAQLGATAIDRGNTIANVIILMARLREEVTLFSRRTERQLMDWAEMPRLNWDVCDEVLRDDALDTIHHGRYQAVNLQNDSTIEFRVFRGSLKRDTIVASIQLCNNFCLFAMTHTIAECRTASFHEVVQVAPFRELVEYCAERKIYTGIDTDASTPA